MSPLGISLCGKVLGVGTHVVLSMGTSSYSGCHCTVVDYGSLAMVLCGLPTWEVFHFIEKYYG